MLRCCNFLTVLLLLSPAISVGRVPSGDSPAFTAVPELSAGFDLLYEQKFAEARQIFASWESRNLEDPFGEVAVAASYLFEELYLHGVLTSDFFLNEKRFLHGIDSPFLILLVPSPTIILVSRTSNGEKTANGCFKWFYSKGVPGLFQSIMLTSFQGFLMSWNSSWPSLLMTSWAAG